MDGLVEPPSFVVRPPADPNSHPVVNEKHPYNHTLRVSYPDADSAMMVFRSVSVDEEVRPDRNYRHVRVDGTTIECYFSALELKSLRVSISSFLEMLALATDTLAQFKLSDHK